MANLFGSDLGFAEHNRRTSAEGFVRVGHPPRGNLSALEDIFGLVTDRSNSI